MSRRDFIASTAALPAVGGIAAPAAPDGTAAKRIAGDFDVIVAGGGPAGIAAAISAARSGAKTMLFETEGALGGVWTGGLLTCIIGFNKTPLDREITARLDRYGARTPRQPTLKGTFDANYIYEPEYMKVVLEEMCAESGVKFRLHSPVVAAERDATGRNIVSVATESASGRETWTARMFIDCTGDGTLAARAGCAFDTGDGSGGPDQPGSLIALVTVDDDSLLRPFTVNEASNYDEFGKVPESPKERLRDEIRRVGLEPSYSAPTLFRIRRNLFGFVCNHEYGVPLDDADAITAATVRARKEIVDIVTALAGKGGPRWKGFRVITTAAHLAPRGARRIRGRYTITTDDVAAGRTFPDAIATSNFVIDIHGTTFASNKKLPAGNPGVKFKPFQIPLRSCQAKDLDNLYMAGRCISGDFVPQASYRVVGTAVAMGCAVGRDAASRALRGAKRRSRRIPVLPL